jgi:TetR/AcrR family transcriptional regulator, cholesterol catabolism regulator
VRSRGTPKKGSAEPNRQLKARTEEVYTKAAILFKEKGYLNASVNEIASKLKIQKASLYYYIKDKEALLFEILNRTMDNMLQVVGDLPSEDLSPDQKLDHAIRAHIVNASQYLNEFSVLLHDTKHLRPAQRKIILSKRDQYEEFFVRILREGIAKKVFANQDAKVLAYMILGSCNWIYQWFSPRGRKSPEEIADLFSNVFLEGVLMNKA